MTVVSILLGLLGLGIVVFFHELGHFAMARAVGVEVEEFSLGWGPKLLAFKRGATTYRLSVLPIGGYCRMRGEDGYRKAIEQNLVEFPREPGSYFAAPPFKRMLIALGGPVLNVVFAFVVFAAIAGAGYTVETWGNRVVAASEFEGREFPADAAGIRTGDAIVAIDGKPVASFADIQETVALSADRPLRVTLERDGSRVETTVTPVLDRGSGAGLLGIYSWIDPVVGAADPDGAARLAGIEPGDRIVAVDGAPLRFTAELHRRLSADQPRTVTIGFVRDGRAMEAVLVPSYGSDGVDLGISWKTVRFEVKASGLLDALRMGAGETVGTVSATLKGLASLFMGVDLLKAVSGPARITWIVGQVAADGFSGGVASGMSASFNFLAVLSIGLFAMNLLPIPLLDGGWMLLFLVEAIRRKPVKVRTVFKYQTIGIIVVAALFLLTTVGDILFFSGRR